METDPSSLKNLNDIVLPPDIPVWPLAPGWWLLIFATLILATWIGYKSYLNWKANAYRRTALRELEAANTPASVAAILRRCSLVIAPRNAVAQMHGESWTDWLSSTAPHPPSEAVKRLLVSGPYLQTTTDSRTLQPLKAYAISWIKTHCKVRTPSPT